MNQATSRVRVVAFWSKALGAKLAEARKAQGLKQKQLAKAVGLEDAQHISNLERFFRGVTPSDDVLSALERELKVSLREEPKHTTDSTTVDYEIDKDPNPIRAEVRRKFQAIYDELSPRGRSKFDRRSLGSPNEWTADQWEDLLTTIRKSERFNLFDDPPNPEPYTPLVPKKKA